MATIVGRKNVKIKEQTKTPKAEIKPIEKVEEKEVEKKDFKFEKKNK